VEWVELVKYGIKGEWGLINELGGGSWNVNENRIGWKAIRKIEKRLWSNFNNIINPPLFRTKFSSIEILQSNNFKLYRIS
jgi:hypothetical protein